MLRSAAAYNSRKNLKHEATYNPNLTHPAAIGSAGETLSGSHHVGAIHSSREFTLVLGLVLEQA